MASKRNWQSLSAAYRGRLERSGVTRKEYESGASLSAGRGHAKTPERPERALRNPSRYPEYATKRRAATEREKTARKLRDDVKRIARRYGLDVSEVLKAIPTEDRAEFVAGWQIANAEYRAHKSGTYGRQRLDELEQDYPELEKAIGFYR